MKKKGSNKTGNLELMKKLLSNKNEFNKRVRKGEKVSDIAKELGIKIVNPL